MKILNVSEKREEMGRIWKHKMCLTPKCVELYKYQIKCGRWPWNEIKMRHFFVYFAHFSRHPTGDSIDDKAHVNEQTTCGIYPPTKTTPVQRGLRDNAYEENDPEVFTFWLQK